MIPLLESKITEQYYLMLSQSSSGQVPFDQDDIRKDMMLIAHDQHCDYYLFCEQLGYITQFQSKEEILEYMIKTSYSNVMFWGYVDKEVKDKLKEWC